ncbi:MAG TPA: Ig-like domain-containing protein, partial [Gemmatimonadales bacterium]|nr:Ig-like domain-containing protein [Gemmatimonadales bacterium]
MTSKKTLVLTALGIALVVSCERVVAPGSISQFVVSPNTVTLQPNQVQDFTAVGFTGTGDSANIAVTWSATGGAVDASDNGMRHYGHYHSADCGVFHLVATSHPGALSDSAIVTVAGCNVSVASVSVSPASATVSVNQSVHLTATPKDANGNALIGRAITWSSSNTSVAVADVNGNVTGLATGSATITATSEGQSGTATITVTDVPVASVTVTPASASVAAGSTVQLTATAKDANGNILSGRIVTWSSTNTAAAVVNTSGRVTGMAAGSATIRATSEGQSGTSAITVTAVPVASVTVTPASASVAAGNTVQLTATPKDANGNTLSGRVVTWSSNNTAAAVVNASGLVTGMAAGSATITATSEGQSGTSAITVTGSSGGSCTTSTTAFQNAAFDSQSGSFTAAFDATPNGSGIDAVTGLSQGAAAAYTDLAVIIRFNSSGTIDARNG